MGNSNNPFPPLPTARGLPQFQEFKKLCDQWATLQSELTQWIAVHENTSAAIKRDYEGATTLCHIVKETFGGADFPVATPAAPHHPLPLGWDVPLANPVPLGWDVPLANPVPLGCWDEEETGVKRKYKATKGTKAAGKRKARKCKAGRRNGRWAHKAGTMGGRVQDTTACEKAAVAAFQAAVARLAAPPSTPRLPFRPNPLALDHAEKHHIDISGGPKLAPRAPPSAEEYSEAWRQRTPSARAGQAEETTRLNMWSEDEQIRPEGRRRANARSGRRRRCIFCADQQHKQATSLKNMHMKQDHGQFERATSSLSPAPKLVPCWEAERNQFAMAHGELWHCFCGQKSMNRWQLIAHLKRTHS